MSLKGKLQTFAEGLAPDNGLFSRAKQTIRVMSRVIQAHFKGSGVIDRITPFGSIPKKTSIHGIVDIDVIIYVNNQHPPFHDLVEELYNILPCSCKRRAECHCDKNEYGIKFCYDGFKIDLLPAVNFLPSGPRRRFKKGESVRVQRKRALEFVKQIPEDRRHYYSTSLSCASVLFEKKRDSFSHSLSRLAKYWCSKIPVYFNGRSSIMEYMGAYAADLQKGSKDIVEGFRRFLQLFESPYSINIYWTYFYHEKDVPKAKWTESPLLLDPCNPYNNFLDAESNGGKIFQLVPYAKATLSRLDEAEMLFDAGEKLDIDDIFCQDYYVPFPDESDSEEEMEEHLFFDDNERECCLTKKCFCSFLGLCLSFSMAFLYYSTS